MQKYLDAVGILTLVVMVPLCLGTAYGFISGSIAFEQYVGYWKEVMLLLVGFWLRGASASNAATPEA